MIGYTSTEDGVQSIIVDLSDNKIAVVAATSDDGVIGLITFVQLNRENDGSKELTDEDIDNTLAKIIIKIDDPYGFEVVIQALKDASRSMQERRNENGKT